MSRGGSFGGGEIASPSNSISSSSNNNPKPDPKKGEGGNDGDVAEIGDDEGVTEMSKCEKNRIESWLRWGSRGLTSSAQHRSHTHPLIHPPTAGSINRSIECHQSIPVRETQAARDVERDTLSVNGVLVRGSEGYPVVVGKVRRELARLAEPVASPDAGGEGGGGGGGGGGAAAAAAVARAPVRAGCPPPRFFQSVLACPVSRARANIFVVTDVAAAAAVGVEVDHVCASFDAGSGLSAMYCLSARCRRRCCRVRVVCAPSPALG